MTVKESDLRSACEPGAKSFDKRDSAGWHWVIVAAMAFAVIILVPQAPAYCFPWSIDMFRGPAVQPLAEAPRVMPKGTLPITGGLPAMNLEQMTIKLHNPLQATSAHLAHGKELYGTVCAVCHGESGVGDGTVAHLLKRAPANLMSGVTKNLPDGYIYGYIRDGGIAMPSYDDAMSSDERWEVVLYVRDMQAKFAAKGKVADK